MKSRPPSGAKTSRTGATRPFVLVNMAMTADGKIATANRRVSSFSSSYDQEHLMKLRTTADAVMAGARTVDLNEVNLGPGAARFQNLRRRRGLRRYNLRIVVSGRGTLDPNAAIFRHKFSEVIVLATQLAGKQALQDLRQAGAIVRVCGARGINWKVTLRWLHQRWGVKRLLCEGGGEVNDGLFRAGVVDELHLTVCPCIFGGRKAPTIVDGIGAPSLAQAWPLKLKSARRRADELYLLYRKA